MMQKPTSARLRMARGGSAKEEPPAALCGKAKITGRISSCTTIISSARVMRCTGRGISAAATRPELPAPSIAPRLNMPWQADMIARL